MTTEYRLVLEGEKYGLRKDCIPDMLNWASRVFDMGEIIDSEKTLEIEKWMKDLTASRPHLYEMTIEEIDQARIAQLLENPKR